MNGFISIGISYLATALTVPLIPYIINKIGNRWTMFFGGLCYTFYVLVYLYPIPVLLYCASVIQGLGSSLLWIAQGPVLVINSTEQTISRNSSLFWIMFTMGMFGGNLFVFFAWEDVDVITQSEQNTIALVLGTFSLLGSFLFFFLESDQIEENETSLEMVKSVVRVVKKKELFYLIPTMALSGIELCYFQSLYPTCIGATKRLGSNAAHLTGLSQVMSGIGEIAGAVSLIWMGDNENLRGYYYSIINLFTFGAFFVPTLLLPGECSFMDSYQRGLLMPNDQVLMVCAFVYGFFDGTLNTLLTTMIGLSFTTEIDASGTISFLSHHYVTVQVVL